MNSGVDVLLGSIPFHLKSTSKLYSICICSPSFVQLGDMVANYLESRRFTQPQQEPARDAVVLPNAFQLKCTSLAQWPLCPDKMSYCATTKQLGSWGNQSELRDAWSSLPALTMPGVSTTFWCLQIPLPADVGIQVTIDYLTKQFKSRLHPLLFTQRVARWIQAQFCSKLLACPRLIVLLDVSGSLQPELVSELSIVLNEILKEKLTYSCELHVVTTSASDDCTELNEHLDRVFENISHEEPLSVSVVEDFLKDLNQVITFDLLKKELSLVNTYSIGGSLKRLAEVRGVVPQSDLLSLINAVDGESSQIKALQSSFQEEDAVTMVEDSIQSACEKFQIDKPDFLPDELNLHLQAVGRSIQLQLSEQGIRPVRLDSAAKAEIEAHVSNAVAHTAQIEHDRKYDDIQSAIKLLIDALDASHTQVLKCL